MKIAPADWPVLLRLVDHALGLPPEARDQWVDTLDLPRELRSALCSLLGERASIEKVDFLAQMPELTHRPPTSRQLYVGALIGPWRLLREIGQGGMSAVWLAERADNQIKRQVALKLPHAGPGHELLARRLLRERDILASLEHHNIARLYDVGVSEFGTPYLVMEYVEGKTLLDHANAQCMSVCQRLVLFQQVLAATQYSHDKHILHRDLKPNNMLVDRAGKVKLLDFGIACALQDHAHAGSTLTRHSGHLLTPEYAAPERLTGGVLDVGSDIYSLGVILFELLTGERPYVGTDGTPVVGAMLQDATLVGEPRRASTLWRKGRDSSAYADTPTAIRNHLRGNLDLIIRKALEKDPSRRHRSVEALSQDIARHLEGGTIASLPFGLTFRSVMLVGRRPKVMAALGAVSVGALVGYLGGHTRPSLDPSEQYWSNIGPKQARNNCEFSGTGDTEFGTAVAAARCKTVPLNFFGGVRSFRLDDSSRGQRAVLRAEVRVHLESPAASARLWLRVDAANGESFYLDNMGDRPLISSDDWQTVEVEVVVPTDAQDLKGGLALLGAGVFEARDLVVTRRDMSSAIPLGGNYMDPDHPETPPRVAQEIRAARKLIFENPPNAIRP